MCDFSPLPRGLGKSSKKSESRKIAAGNKQLADTGNYPGEDEITQGLTLINPLIADKNSEKFIERFNTLKKDLLYLADHFHDLEHFFDYQRPTWEKLRKAHVAFQLNRLELEKDAQSRFRPQANAGKPVGPKSLWTDSSWDTILNFSELSRVSQELQPSLTIPAECSLLVSAVLVLAVLVLDANKLVKFFHGPGLRQIDMGRRQLENAL